MKGWHQAAWLALGVFSALIAPVNSIVAGVLSPLVSSITGGKGTYS
jgi:hypothetical protein